MLKKFITNLTDKELDFINKRLKNINLELKQAANSYFYIEISVLHDSDIIHKVDCIFTSLMLTNKTSECYCSFCYSHITPISKAYKIPFSLSCIISLILHKKDYYNYMLNTDLEKYLKDLQENDLFLEELLN